ncbi:hypothetical protein BGX31_011655 [Mortierella sp. GBA43]|nr:hypothetical protein BGX31_011655 [Mortierella sp. GBA43]
MGVTGLFQHLTTHGLSPAPVNIQKFLGEHGSPTHLDLFGTCWHNVRSKIVDAKQSDTSIVKVGYSLAMEFKRLFGTGIVIHIDGSPCNEKEKARTERAQRRHKQESILDNSLNILENNSINGIWTPRRIMKRVTKALTMVHMITDEDKDRLEEGLQTVFHVCRCATEADVCIGVHNDPDLRIAISANSDLLAFTGVSTLVRPLRRRRRKYAIYNKNDVLSALNLPSELHLLIFASISNNDHVKNVKTLAHCRNLSLVREIKEGDVNQMLQDYIASASNFLDIDLNAVRSSFEMSLSVYANGAQTPVNEPLLNHKFDQYRTRIQNAKVLRHQVSLEKRIAKDPSNDHPSFYVAQGSKRNQFRPNFSSQSSILKGCTVPDIRGYPTRTRPPLKHPPRRRKAKKKEAKKTSRKHEGRNPIKAKTDDTPVRNLMDAAHLDHEYRKNHPLKALTVGSVKAAANRNGVLHSQETEALSQQLRGAVVVLNRLRHYAYWAMALDIKRILEQPGTPESRKGLLDEILDDANYANRLATILLTGKVGEGSGFAKALKKGRDIKKPHYMTAYDNFKATTRLTAIKDTEVVLEDAPGFDHQKLVLTKAMETLMAHVQSSLRSHYRNASFEVENDQRDSKSAVEFFFEQNEQEEKYPDFPTSSWSARSEYLSENALVDILWCNNDTRETLKRLFNTTLKNETEQIVLGRKGLLISKLFYDPDNEKRRDGYHRKVGFQEDEKPRKYRINGTICTNGLALSIITYDTSQPKRKARSEEEDTHPIEQLELDDPFLGSTGFKQEGEKHTEHDPGSINWKKGSDLLENVEVRFDTPERCPPIRKTTIVGCDPGMINALTFSRLDPSQPFRRETVKITAKFLCLPLSRFRHLQQRKYGFRVDTLESSMPLLKRTNIHEFFSWINTTKTGSRSHLEKLQCFYESRWYLKKSWDLCKAQRATFDYVVRRVLDMLGKQGVLVIGLGPSKSTTLMRHLITQVRHKKVAYSSCLIRPAVTHS